jgi:hypothetical protein
VSDSESPWEKAPGGGPDRGAGSGPPTEPAPAPEPETGPGGTPAQEPEAGPASGADPAPEAGPAVGGSASEARPEREAAGSSGVTSGGSAPDSPPAPEAMPASGSAFRAASVATSGPEPEGERTVRPGTLLEDADARVPEPDAPDPGGRPTVAARRFWAGRRVPAAITAAAILAVAGLFLYDIAAVRTDRDAMAWRTRLADELATRHLDDIWVVLGAAVAAALGLWLILLALTPGERGLLPMARHGTDGVRAALDRRAAELVLRDRAMQVAGVRWVRVTVGRRRINARGVSHFRELDDVRRDLTAALDSAVRQLGLARPPQLHVHVQRGEKKG